METIIVICLLIVIALLVQDKVVIKKRVQEKPEQEKANPVLPDIMGQPKQHRSLSVPNTANERHMQEPEINPDNFDIEYDENEIAGIQVPQEELDEVFSNTPDFEQEEDEWSGYGTTGGDNGLAQGVTFEELSAVGMLLQTDSLEPSQKETAAATVRKIQGTELFSLLESSMADASGKIAALLDSTLPAETPPGSSIMRNDDLDGFDIGEFA